MILSCQSQFFSSTCRMIIWIALEILKQLARWDSEECVYPYFYLIELLFWGLLGSFWPSDWNIHWRFQVFLVGGKSIGAKQWGTKGILHVRGKFPYTFCLPFLVNIEINLIFDCLLPRELRKPDPANVAKVKALYKELDLQVPLKVTS